MRMVVVVQGGLVQDVYIDQPFDGDFVVVDYDAREFADADDDRVRTIDREEAWVTGYPPVVDAKFIERVFEAW